MYYIFEAFSEQSTDGRFATEKLKKETKNPENKKINLLPHTLEKFENSQRRQILQDIDLQGKQFFMSTEHAAPHNTSFSQIRSAYMDTYQTVRVKQPASAFYCYY